LLYGGDAVIYRLVVCCVLLGFANASVAAAAEKPNLVVFICDDLGCLDTQPYGATDVRTPNMQRLASEGLRDKSGKTLIGAEKITAAETVMQTAGFGSMRTSESYDRGEAIRVARDTEREESQRLKNRVLNATTPEERREAMRDVREFAKRAKNPLTYSEILRSMQSRKYDEMAIEEYGAPLRNEDVLFSEEGDPYDYEDEEE